MANSNPWDIHTSLHRNPSTATGASMFSRYDSRRSIASTVVGPPPLSPRPGGGPPSLTGGLPSFDHIRRQSAGSPWPMASPPSSPGPAPPPPVQQPRGFSHGQGQPLPLTIPPGPGNILPPLSSAGSLSPIAPRTPIQQLQGQRHHSPQPQQSRAAMEQAFAQKHAQLVDQAKLLLAEMRTLQILGPVHGAVGGSGTATTVTTTQSDDGSTSGYFPGSDDASSLLSGGGNGNGVGGGGGGGGGGGSMAVYYEQDEMALAALDGILGGKLGEVGARPPPRSARAVAREVVGRAGLVGGDDEGEAEAIELLMGDYEAVMDWARSASGMGGSNVASLLSSGASSSSSVHAQGQGQGQSRVQRCLSERQALLEAALPAGLAHLSALAMMHFGHEKLYASSPFVRVTTPSVRSGVNGNYGNGSLSVNGSGAGGRERGLGYQQVYANSMTFRDGTPVEDIPRRRFMKTDDGFAWDMLELASELENEVMNLPSNMAGRRLGSLQQRILQLRNPVTREFFTPADVNRILAHPMGRGLVPSPPERGHSASPSPTGSSPMPLPQPASSSMDNQDQHNGNQGFGDGEYKYQGEYRPQLFGHDDDIGEAQIGRRDSANDNGNNHMEMSWPSSSPLGQPPTIPFSVTPEPPDIPRSPPPPLPTIATSSNYDRDRTHDRDSYLPEPIRPWSPPSSPPPPVSSIVNDTASAQEQPQEQGQQLPEHVFLSQPLPGAYPVWGDHEQEQGDSFNPDLARNSRHELLASSSPVPAVSSPRPATNNTSEELPGTSFAATPTPNTTASSNTGEYRSSFTSPNNPFSSSFRPTQPTTTTAPDNPNTTTTTVTSTPSYQPTQSYRSSIWSNPLSSRDSTGGGVPLAEIDSIGAEARGTSPTPSPWNNGGNNRDSGGDYWSSRYLVATPPPSGPIPVSSLGNDRNAVGASSAEENRYQLGGRGYPFPSELGGGQQQQQRGREDGHDNNLGGEYHPPSTNPFASSRDNSPHGEGRVESVVAEMDAGPFELDDNPPRLTLRGLHIGERGGGGNGERNSDADSSEWKGRLASI